MPRTLMSSPSSWVLPFLSFVLFLTCCGRGEAGLQDWKKHHLIPYDPSFANITVDWGHQTDFDANAYSFRSPGLAFVDEKIVAFAEAQPKNSAGDNSTRIALRVIEDGEFSTSEFIDLNEKSWEAYLPKEQKQGQSKGSDENELRVLKPTVVARKGNVFYAILGKHVTEEAPLQDVSDGTKDWNFFLAKGEIDTTASHGKKIKWTNAHSFWPHFPIQISHRGLSGFVGSGGATGVVTEQGALLLPIEAKNRAGSSVSLVLRSNRPEKDWGFSWGTTARGCSNPAIAEWDETRGFFLMITSCDDGQYTVVQSKYLWEEWDIKDATLSHVWRTSKDQRGNLIRSGFISTSIVGKKVLLLSMPVHSPSEEEKEKGKNGKGQLHLWVTDRQRVYNVGPISREGDSPASSTLLLNDKGTLISMYENEKGDTPSTAGLVSVLLNEQWARINTVVKRWATLDTSLRPCVPSISRVCTEQIPTSGLVGLLSGTLTDKNQWNDEYFCVNATVHGEVESTANGLKFKESTAGAEWPVGKLEQYQPYYFANNRFTLVATVTIHEEPTAEGENNSPIPLIGVKANDANKTVLFGLSYTKKNWFPVVYGSNTPADSHSESWTPNEVHQVVIQKDSNKVYMYVDGNKVVNGEDLKVNMLESHRISHFSFGGFADDKNTDAKNSQVTVANVLLYNRVLSTTEINTLRQKTIVIPAPGIEVKLPSSPQPPLERPNVPTSGSDSLPGDMPLENNVSDVNQNESDNALNSPVVLPPPVNVDPAIRQKKETPPAPNTIPQQQPSSTNSTDFVSQLVNGDSTVCEPLSRLLLFLFAVCGFVVIF